jgi:hypothetical protein
MIFSDLYVRFYSEAFKFVDAQGPGELERFFEAIASNVAPRALDLFMQKGFRGMDEYWGKVSREENCRGSSCFRDGVREGHMTRCPSLSKVMDSDAAPFPKYCLHCPGWVRPLMTRSGFYCVYCVVALDRPECRSFFTESREKAEGIARNLLAEGYDPALVFTNLDHAEEVEENQRRRKQLYPASSTE